MKANNNESTSRTQALDWWNNLAPLRKTQICDTNLNLLGSIRRWETLTGSEIEQIWINETNICQRHSFKPNQKQFKEFAPELALAYVNKFDNKGKRDFFKLMLQLMQEQIIGYINVYGNHFEPAISETETFMPLSSFGLSNTHTSTTKKFIPFPNGKTLSDMCKEPIEFDNWCKENGIY